ncbi:hypothetical protein ACFX13_040231 [Malus domestica]
MKGFSFHFISSQYNSPLRTPPTQPPQIQMALIRERRQLNLRLPLPDLSERRPRFSLPLPPTAPTTAVTTNTSSCAAISAADLERLEVLGHGNGGTVYKVRHKRTSANYAYKLVQGDSDLTVRR